MWQMLGWRGVGGGEGKGDNENTKDEHLTILGVGARLGERGEGGGYGEVSFLFF